MEGKVRGFSEENIAEAVATGVSSDGARNHLIKKFCGQCWFNQK
jgi:hypothetical protein